MYPTHAYTAGGFEHVLHLPCLQEVEGIWDAFEELPPELADASVQEKLAYLRSRLEESAGPLL